MPQQMTDKSQTTADPWPVALAKMLSPESSAALADAMLGRPEPAADPLCAKCHPIGGDDWECN